jgi:hypothetical protein
MHVCTKRVLCEPALRVLGHHAEPHVPTRSRGYDSATQRSARPTAASSRASQDG